MQFTINQNPYNMGYNLANGIYPNWATFVKTIPMPQGEKKEVFAKCQESTRKDVEQAFGILKSRFAIICDPSRAWDIDIMKDIILTYIILHDMIVEDEQDTYNDNIDVDYDHIDNEISTDVVSHDVYSNFVTYLQMRCHMHTKQKKKKLSTTSMRLHETYLRMFR